MLWDCCIQARTHLRTPEHGAHQSDLIKWEYCNSQLFRSNLERFTCVHTGAVAVWFSLDWPLTSLLRTTKPPLSTTIINFSLSILSLRSARNLSLSLSVDISTGAFLILHPSPPPSPLGAFEYISPILSPYLIWQAPVLSVWQAHSKTLIGHRDHQQRHQPGRPLRCQSPSPSMSLGAIQAGGRKGTRGSWLGWSSSGAVTQVHSRLV